MIGPIIASLAFTEPASGIALPTWGTARPGLIAVGFVVFNIIFAARWLPESKPDADPHTVRRSIRGTVVDYLLRPFGDVARLVWIYAVGMLGFMSMTAVLAFYLADGFGVSEKTIGFFFMYFGALSLIMRAVILGPMVDAFGETRVMRTGAIFLAVGLVTLPLPQNVFVLAALMGLVPVGTALLFPCETALVTHLVADEERGQILGVQQAFGAVSRVIAPLWATAAYHSVGHHVPFYFAGGVVALVTLLAFRVPEKPSQPHLTQEAA
jgi:MFS family permease